MTPVWHRRTIDLPASLWDAIDAESGRRNVTKASVIRWALKLGLRDLAARPTAEKGAKA